MPRWNFCNILQAAPGARKLWQFEAKGGGFVLSREHSGELPKGATAKSWSSLWQPKLNVAWLPPEKVFLRVVELPKSPADETRAMVELQLEKLSPLPVAQIVWTYQILPHSPAENLQTILVVIAERRAVEEFLGKLEEQNFLADRLEAPMLDELQAAPAEEDGAWVYPEASGGKNSALIAWWCGGALRSLSFIVLPVEGDRTKSLKEQLTQLVWAGEVEGWLVAQPKWHLVAEGATAGEWGTWLRESLGEPVQVSQPLPPEELAARTARRSAGTNPASALLPAEFSKRYQERFSDRLWLHGLFAAGLLYLIGLAIYFSGTELTALKTHKVEQQVAAISNNYTNALQLKARYDILKERQELKFAALDCWKIVAEQLPEGVSLQRFSFANGQKLTLSGTAPSDQINAIFNFNSAMQKATLNGQPMFEGGEPVSPRNNGNNLAWSFSLQLKKAEERTP